MTKLATINPRTGEQSSIELQLGELAIRRAKTDLAVSRFVAELARPHLPDGFILLGHDFRTP
jgi:hypothetical protein